jgi:predicted N-acetyltransferase YhbS
MTVRTEKTDDAEQIRLVISRAFESIPFSDHTEQILVERLRASKAYVPQLALVAEVGSQIVGHILLTRVTIRDGQRSVDSLALAPLSVLPEFQRQGVGMLLIKEAHQRAGQLGFQSVVVVGYLDYYQRFGYVPLKAHDIRVPFEVREENCMIVVLTEDGLRGVKGMVEYPREWMEK